jgi:hypothetical protein
MSRIKTSLWGQKVGLDYSDRLINVNGFRSGSHGNQMDYVSPYTVIQLDDFMGDTLNTFLWHNPTKGSDAATVDFAVTQAVNGTAVGVTGAGAGASMAVNGILIDGGLDWKANQGSLDMQVRLKTSAITNLCLYVGFTDQVSTLEMPFTISGSTITSNTTDGCGFLFDTAATAATWKLLGVANDVDATLQEAVQSTTTLTTAPVAATYTTLRVAVATDGSATFFIDGKPVGIKMTGAVTATVALTPVVAAFTRSAASDTVTIDYISVSGLRV